MSQGRRLVEVLCQQFLHMTELPKPVGNFDPPSLPPRWMLSCDYHLTHPHTLLQDAVLRAKQQLKSAMMMNLESKAIIFEDIGRYSQVGY